MKVQKFRAFVSDNRHRGLLFKRLTNSRNTKFSPVHHIEKPLSNPEYLTNVGITEIWLAPLGKNKFEDYKDKTYQGVKVTNSKGRFIVATRIMKEVKDPASLKTKKLVHELKALIKNFEK